MNRDSAAGAVPQADVGPAAPPGEAVLTRLDDGRLRVDRADPVIWIANELLDAENVRIERDGDIVTFGDVGRVSYRITERHNRHVVAERLP